VYYFTPRKLQNYYANDLRKTIRSPDRKHQFQQDSLGVIVFSSHFNKALIIFRCIYYYYAETKVENVFVIYFKTNIQNSFVLVNFVCHTPQFKMLVFAFQSEPWIAQNLNFTVFEAFCLSLP